METCAPARKHLKLSVWFFLNNVKKYQSTQNDFLVFFYVCFSTICTTVFAHPKLAVKGTKPFTTTGDMAIGHGKLRGGGVNVKREALDAPVFESRTDPRPLSKN